jgi:hypothetical protein
VSVTGSRVPGSFTTHAQSRTKSVRRRGAKPARLARLGLPAVDAVALVVATALAGHGRGLAIAYGVVAFLMLVVNGTQRARINLACLARHGLVASAGPRS